MFITETVYFKEPIVTFGIPAFEGGSGSYRPLDIFHTSVYGVPDLPTHAETGWNPDDPRYTGGNFGDD